MHADDTTKATTGEAPAAGRTASPHYVIRIGGHLDARWATWFDGMSLTNERDGTTAIRGPIVDQAALHGLLQKLRDVNVTLISLTPADPTEDRPEGNRHDH